MSFENKEKIHAIKMQEALSETEKNKNDILQFAIDGLEERKKELRYYGNSPQVDRVEIALAILKLGVIKM